MVGTIIDNSANANLNNLTTNAPMGLNSVGARTVTETYVNGSNWYRIYSDGWCEQGGSFGAFYGTVNLLKQYKDTNYSAFCTTIRNGQPYSAEGCASVSVISSSQLFVSSGASAYGGYWEAKGYLI